MVSLLYGASNPGRTPFSPVAGEQRLILAAALGVCFFAVAKFARSACLDHDGQHWVDYGHAANRRKAPFH